MRTRFLALTALILFSLTAATTPALAADANGKWKSTFDTAIGVQSYVFEFKVDGKTLTGKATHTHGKSNLKEGKIDGDKIAFVEDFEYEGNAIRIEYSGHFNGNDKINLTRKVADFAVEEIVAERVKE